MARLVLWDIDGTLIRAGDIGAVIFDRALEATFGRRPPERVQMSGKTDQQIVREYLAILEIAEEEGHMASVLALLEAELAANGPVLAERGYVLPGVERLLAELASEPGYTQTVLTGNIVANARLKLAAFGLDRFVDLEVGAFGSDHADRNELVPVALRRAEAVREKRFSPEEVVVIGDSANDLACARAAGVRCALVATGRAPAGELAELGPDALFDDLSDTGAVRAFLDA